jgi:hypothetical protein
MGQVSFVFRAEGFEQFGVRHEAEADANGDRLDVGLRIVDRDAGLQMAEITATKAFRQTQEFVVRVSDRVQGTLSLKPTVSARNESPVHFPKPARLRIVRKLAAIAENLAEYILLLQKQHRPGRLDNLVGNRKQVRERQTRRRAKRGRLSPVLGHLPE